MRFLTLPAEELMVSFPVMITLISFFSISWITISGLGVRVKLDIVLAPT
jgi:hypothetical protein